MFWVGGGVKFSEQPPSKQWANLTFRGERIADVWFKPEGEPSTVVFRIPRGSFQLPGIAPRLTAESLLKSVGIAPEEVEAWRPEGAMHSSPDAPCPELTSPLPQPADDAPHLEIHVRLKPAEATTHESRPGPDAALVAWHDLEAQWKTVLGLEAAVDAMRKSTETIRAAMEGEMRRSLTADEKVYALAADLAQWNKAKNRAHYALPKANEFIHRATWAAGTPERKKLGELFKDPVTTHASLPPVNAVGQELEMLRKDLQVLSAKGGAVYQECKTIVSDVQSALRRLQSNAATRASQKKDRSIAKDKSY
jgi:hypothetical protein